MGNKLGWILAVILAAAVLGYVANRKLFVHPSQPTEASLAAGFLDCRTLAASPTALGAAMDSDADAADHYRAAAALARQHRQLLASVQARKPSAGGALDAETMKVLDAIYANVAAGAACKTMQPTLGPSPTELRIAFSFPAADELYEVSEAMDALATCHFLQRRLEDARKVLLAELTMGYHVSTQRSLPYVVSLGLDIQSKAIGALEDMYEMAGDDPARLKAVKAYAGELASLRAFWQNKSKVLWSAQPHPGDVFNVVQNDKDRCWRIQGLLALGLVKFTATKADDERHAKAILDRYAASSDPYEAAAAAAARDLTQQQFRQLGRDF